jgi:hypothetical protein
MDTFIPLRSFEASAEVLRPQEALISLEGAIRLLELDHEVGNLDRNKMIARHPLVQMWGRHTPVLCTYAYAMLERMKSDQEHRRLPNSQRMNFSKLEKNLDYHMECASSGELVMEKPRWLGNEKFHQTQRAALMRLEPEHYGKEWPDEDMHYPTFWPVS